MRFSMKLISALGAIVLALTGVTVQADSPKAGGTLIMSIGTTPRHLNPAVQSGIATGAPGAQLFATLLRFDDKWNPHPYLAKSWQVSDDSRTVTFNLVEGATFHDGTPITSNDVAFSIKFFHTKFFLCFYIFRAGKNLDFTKFSETHFCRIFR